MKIISAEQRVVDGMAVLYENKPDWLKSIDPEKLDMKSRKNNLLVQLFGPVKSARKMFGVPHEVTLGQLGFRRIRWMYLHPTSQRALRREELENETWEKVCVLWVEIIKRSLELVKQDHSV